MEDVIVSFARRTSPNVCKSIAQLLHVVQVSEKDFVVNGRPEVSGLEEVDRVEVGNVHPPGVG